MFRKRPRDESESKALARRAEEAQPPAAPAAPVLHASLEVAGGPDKGETFPLTRMVTLIGRQESCDIVLKDQSVSREHGQIEQHQNEWIYTNLSENGTWINRKKVERIVLRSGDAIEMGAETRLKFLLKEPAKVEVAPLVRRRPRPSREAPPEEQAADQEAPTAAAAIGGGFLKKRKMLVAIGIYLMLILAFMVAMTLRKSSKPGTAAPLRKLTKEQLRTAFEKIAFDGGPAPPLNSTMANKKLEEAYLYYQKKDYGDLALYNAVKAFEESMVYGGGFFRENKDKVTYDTAKAQLGDRIWKLYDAALLEETKGHPAEARRHYEDLLRRVAYNNWLFKHVDLRLRRLPTAGD